MKSNAARVTQPAIPATVPPWPANDLEAVERCPVCRSSERALLHDGLTDRVFRCAPGTWTLYACLACGSAYLNPRPTFSSIDRAYAEYFTHASGESVPTNELPKAKQLRRSLANGYRNWRFGTRLAPATSWGVPLALVMPRMHKLLDVAYRHLPKPSAGARLLDIGAGNGDFLDLARSAGWAVQGVEPDRKAATVCRDRGLDVRVGGIEQFAEERGRFDYITISHVIEHVHDPRGLLMQAFDLLEPGGCLYIDTPNIDAFGHKRYGDAWRGLEPPRHLVLFNWHSLERVLRDVGFKCVMRKPRTSVYPELAARSRALAQGRDSYRAKPSLGDKITGRILAARMPFKYRDSEFVTLLSYKSAAQQ